MSNLFVESSSWLDNSLIKRFEALANRQGDKDIYLCFHVPTLWNGADVYNYYRVHNPGYKWYIGGTMFETDRIPAPWVDACNRMDEIWVPTKFNLETFSKSGVERSKIQVIPFGIDHTYFDPLRVEPLPIEGKHGFTFLSTFQWTRRKGWDVLLKAYLRAFTSKDDVCLVIRSYYGKSESVGPRLAKYLEDLGYNPGEIPDIIVLDRALSTEEMPALYAAADAYVLPTRGEGWGIPYMEAMIMGLPTIGTRWSGNLEFMTDENSFLLDIDGLVNVDQEQIRDNPFYAGHKWAEPSEDHLVKLMRHVFEKREEARERGQKAREDVLKNWTIFHATMRMINRLNTIKGFAKYRYSGITSKNGSSTQSATQDKGASVKTNLKGNLGVVWHSPIFDSSGYADESRNILPRLAKAGMPVRAHSITKPSQGFVAGLAPEARQAFERLLTAPVGRQWVSVIHFPAYAFERDPGALANIGRVMFETDRLPEGWVEKCNLMDEIWVPTDFNMRTFAEAGVEPAKLIKVPGGIDLQLYDPGNVTPLDIPGRRGYNFLSIFEWHYRKGWDVLLRAYIEEFKPDEDVSLTLRTYPMAGTDQIGSAKQVQEYIREFVEGELGREFDSIPDILLIDSQLPVQAMPALYAAADAFVLPSRGEGWGRPYMEAMAMGLPTIGTRWSGNLEFMNDDNAYLIDIDGLKAVTEKMEIAFYRGHRWAQPSVDHLKALMRKVYSERAEAKKTGERARKYVAANFTWEQAVRLIVRRLESWELQLGPK